VPRVAPQPAIHHPAGVGRIGLEAGELEVTDRLERQADQPQRHAEHGQHADPRAVARLAELHRQRHDPHQHALQREHGQQADDGEPCAPALAHRPVPVVLRLAVVAPEQVAAEPDPPQGHHRDEQPLAQLVRVALQPYDPRHDHEPETPHDVDDRRVAQRQAEQPGGEHDDRDRDRSGEHGGAGGHGAPVNAASTSASMTEPFVVEPAHERIAGRDVVARDTPDDEPDRRQRFGELGDDARERVETVETGVPREDDVGVRRSLDERRRPARPRWEQPAQVAEPLGPFGITLGDLLERPRPLDRVGTGALAEDDGGAPGAHAARQLAQRGELGVAVGRLAIEEVVGHAQPDDVEARVEQQLALEHVTRPEVGLHDDRPCRQQRVGEAGVTAEDDHVATGEHLAVLEPRRDARGRPERAHERSRPPAHQPVLGGRVRRAPRPGAERSQHAGHLDPRPAHAEREQAYQREPEAEAQRVDEQHRREPQRDRHGDRDREDEQRRNADPPAAQAFAS
jgi:hypothetical protein